MCDRRAESRAERKELPKGGREMIVRFFRRGGGSFDRVACVVVHCSGVF